MNKRFSTLIAAFAALAAVSSAQVADKYVYLATSADTLTWAKTDAKKDSAAFKKGATGTAFDTKLKKDSALWKLTFVEKYGSDSVYTIKNKATKKNLSFAIKKTGDNTTLIGQGVDKFIVKGGAASPIYANYGTDTTVTFASTVGQLVLTKGSVPNEAQKFSIKDADVITLTAKDLAGNVGSVKFDFNGKKGGLFADTTLLPVAWENNKIKFKVAGQEKMKDTEIDQFITLDTVKLAGVLNIGGFQLDTLVTTESGSSKYQGLGNAGLQAFNVRMDLGRDSIILGTDTIIDFTGDKYAYTVHGANTDGEYVIGYKTAGVLTIDSAQIELPFISMAKPELVKLPEGTGVYSIQLKSNDPEKASENGLYFTGKADGYSGYASPYVPLTQFYVKENEDGTYSAQAREGAFDLEDYDPADQTPDPTLLEAQMLFENQILQKVADIDDAYAVELYPDEEVVAETEESTSALDTLIIKKMDVDPTDQYLGYKHYTQKDFTNSTIVFKLATPVADDIYLVERADSIIKAAQTTNEEALQLRVGDLFDVNGDTLKYGAQSLGDTLIRVAYTLAKPYADKQTLFDIYNPEFKSSLMAYPVKMTEDAGHVRFAFKAGKKEDEYQIVPVMEGMQMGGIVVDISTLQVTCDMMASEGSLFKIVSGEAPSSKEVTPGHYSISSGSDMLTANADNSAAFMRVGDELKAAAEEKDFALYIDSAYVNRGDDNTTAAYYIYKTAKVLEGATEAVADTIVGNLLTANGSYISAGTNYGDSAIFMPAKVIADSVWYDGVVDDKGNLKKYTIADNKSAVIFEVLSPEEYVIALKNAPTKKLSVFNGVVVFSDKLAGQVVKLGSQSAPTANDATPSVSEVKVIATEGGVQIVGATGKKVVVSNILGQVVANTVINSSDVTIAAPQGVVVIAVEGEEAVKAIVK